MGVLIEYMHCTLSLFIQDGITPLMVASSRGHVDVVRVLIEARADIHSQDKVWHILAKQSTDCDDSVPL